MTDVSVEGVGHAITELQLATDDVDTAAAAYLGVNRTDLRLLGLLDARGQMSAGELAVALALTPASTTVAVQRLAMAGYVLRESDAGDRRRAVIKLTDHARDLINKVYGPLGREGAKVLAGYTPGELAVVRRFLDESIRLQEKHAGRIRRMR